MLAGRIHGWGHAPVLDDVAEPVRKVGEALVRVEAASVNRLDLTVASGRLGTGGPLPYIGGVEGGGTVLESDTWPAGTQVLIRGDRVGIDRPGTWAERVSVPDAALLPISPRLPHEVAATFFQPACTAYIALHDLANLGGAGLGEPQRVIVVGATGAVGAQVVQQAQALGAEVIAVVGRPTSLSRVPVGVTSVLLSAAPAARALVSRQASLLVDTLGGEGLMARVGWVRPGGRAIVVGYTTGEATRMNIPEWMMSDVQLLPMNMISQEARAREIASGLIGRFADRELTIGVQRFEMNELAHALGELENGRIQGRAYIDLSGI